MYIDNVHLDYPRNVPDLLVFDRNSSPLDESRALVPKGDRPLLRRGARTNFKRNSSITAPQRNRKSESDSVDSSERLQDNSGIIRSTSAEGVTLSGAMSDKEESTVLMEEPLPMLSPVAENEEVRDLCIATRENNREELYSSPPAPLVMARSVSTSTASSNQSRKSAWSWAFWSDEKSSKKNNKIDPNASVSAATITTTATNSTPDNTTTPSTTEDEKSNDNTTTTASNNKRFTLSSLFSRKSKSNNNHNNQNNGTYTTNFELFNDDPKKAPKDFQLNRMYMTRLPLHVERAIYKLSHVKLANPRRPLHEQVLISNQMFWYLSVIATNAPQPAHHDMSIEAQQQPQKKAPRKRLVKKQRPASAPQQQQSRKRVSNSNSSNNSQKGNTPMFMANNPRATESTGFVVPENYLNPKYQKQQDQQQQIKKKPMLGNKNKKNQIYHKNQQQGSDSSSSDDDDDISDDDISDDDQKEIDEKVVISHKEKEDELPLAMYKSNAFKKVK